MRRLRIAAVPGFAALALAVLTALPSPAEAADLSGNVTFVGTAPAPKPITVTKDETVCGKTPLVDDSLLVGAGGGVRNVVVRVLDPKEAPPMQAATPNASVDQNGCRFVPRVRIVPAGAPVDIVNSDGVLHNIHTWSKENPSFNRAQPKFKKVLTETFQKPEYIKITCDVHSWMSGVVVVAAHAFYALSDETGAWTIPGLPPGTYTVEFFHERLGRETKTVTVPASGQARLDFSFKAK